MIVKQLKGIFTVVAVDTPSKWSIRKRLARGSRPTIAELRDQALDALSEPEGVDFGPLSHAERARLLAEKYGI